MQTLYKVDSQAVQSHVADGFKCRRCDGEIQEAGLAEDLMMDGEMNECAELLVSGRHS